MKKEDEQELFIDSTKKHRELQTGTKFIIQWNEKEKLYNIKLIYEVVLTTNLS